MIRNLTNRIILIVVILALALWIDLTPEIKLINPVNDETLFSQNVEPRLGLDLQGGLQVLLEADIPEDQQIDPESLNLARDIVQQRTDALGVNENVIQIAGDRRIVGEFPGLEDTESVLAIIQQTGLLEFVDTGDFSPEEGSVLVTDYSPTGEPITSSNPDEIVYHTIMTGGELSAVTVAPDSIGGSYQISFTLTSEGTKIFADHTGKNSGKFLTILLDKQVISAPVIREPITGGQGSISGNFTADSANAFAVQLRYGSLPVPLKVVETRIIGPTLGADSLDKSVKAGLIGMAIVALFMIIYYRMPGLAAVISILTYALISFAIFKWFHFTLTLPGIAGFLLSTGSALDANILIFERIKEELRNGRNIVQALDLGWTRAWSSIRDSNLSAIITAVILFWFGSSFGATIVKGFSLTLALGVIISLFTAIYITRTILALLINSFKPKNLETWFGL
ncbi:MAG: protein translocase subunit SecD [Anaerolineales bacterium]|uniref:protein translocase subunit SecD n=1 Tax=Candidatus Villigracilis vicinus TaxID=3140679 RepID=UPI0031373048|nr:protein translocase subunit SecD [Anaerolineales bacterium]